MESFWSPVTEAQEPHPAQLRFESIRVEMTLRAFGLLKRLPELVFDYERRWGVKRLTFESFHRFFPTFPFTMQAQSFFRTSGFDHPALGLPRLMIEFHKCFIFERYMMLLEYYRSLSDGLILFAEPIPEESRGLPLAMAFPCDRFRGGLVLHNAPESISLGGKFIYEAMDSAGQLLRLWIEAFGPWLSRLARTGWTPDSPPPRKLSKKKSLLRMGAVLRPWMVEICGGPGPDSYLLAWLMRMRRPRASHAHLLFRHACHDGVWTVLSHKGRARDLGMSPSQIKRAIASLRRRGFITTTRRSNLTHKAITHVRVNIDEIKAALKRLRKKRN
jgi:hypothetical protein